MQGMERRGDYSRALFGTVLAKKTGRKRSLLPVWKLAKELVAENCRNCGASWRDEDTRGVKPNHARLVRAEGALAGRAHCAWSGSYFESVIHGTY